MLDMLNEMLFLKGYRVKKKREKKEKKKIRKKKKKSNKAIKSVLTVLYYLRDLVHLLEANKFLAPLPGNFFLFGKLVRFLVSILYSLFFDYL